MKISYVSKQWLVSVVACLLCLVGALSAVADAKSDISISPKGACAGGGITFVITNKNANSSVHATVTQSIVNSGITTMDISLLPKEQKVLGCSQQGPAGNFLVTWQVQSAQYQ
jgi:hypothetical protein